MNITRPQIRTIRHVVLDMDGTIYLGGKLFDCTRPFLRFLTDHNIGYSFLTNNSSHSRTDYLQRLQNLNVPATPEQIYTSTYATADYMRCHLPEVQRLFVLGTPSLQEEIVFLGFTLADRQSVEPPEGVLVGFDTTLSYPRLCEAAWWIAHGKPFVATHPDFTCPTPEPTILVDCGAICKALEAATGVPPVVIGKPHSCMLEGLCHRHDLRPNQLAVVGDRLMTDIALAQRSGAFGVLVLTGEATREQAAASPWQPDLIVTDLAEFQAYFAAALQTGGLP